MIFSAPIFLFFFLPLTLLIYHLCRKNLTIQNIILLFASLLFYSWGEGFYILILISSILINYISGLIIASSVSRRFFALWVGITLNILLLGTFKYSNFIVDSLNILLRWLGLEPIFLAPVHLPIGISFFTFQAISYLVDVYRRNAPVQRNILHVAIYISLFPQLIAGPIVRYNHIAEKLNNRSVNLDDFADGIKRFIIGLSKKVLIADNLAVYSDQVFSTPASMLSPEAAIIGLSFASLQLLFDFSGYSDMAIGMGKMFGFKFRENFIYPYISKSLSEFWTRWHISLSTWFKDYLYLPLCGRRPTKFKIYRNMFIVFFLCGLWHGANWTYVMWGLIHGIFLTIERLSKRTKLRYITLKLPNFIKIIYTLAIVHLAGVFFRSPSVSYAIDFLYSMFGFNMGTKIFLLNGVIITAFIAGIITATPLVSTIYQKMHQHNAVFATSLQTAALTVLLFLCVITSGANSYQPFVYFRF